MGAVVGLAASPVLAQSAQTPANPQAKKALDPNEVVCEKQEVLGSRLATQKVCHTRAEWAEIKRSDRQDIEKMQVQRGCNQRC
jgi:hypothetical protein